MEPTETQQEQDKRAAAEHAVTFVESGMAVGLGTGSTAIWAAHHIAHLLRVGQFHNITGSATSCAAWAKAEQDKIPMLASNPAAHLSARAGIVEHGRLLNLAAEIIIGGKMSVRQNHVDR